MKILLLNPHIDAQHNIAQALRARGIALLMPSNPEEAWQVLCLHGTSVDLAVIHREGIKGGGDPGIELLYKIKKDPAQADVAVVLTSEVWSAEQCASHQETPMGANAYLRWPFDETELLKTIDSIFGAAEPAQESAPPLPPKIEPPSTGEFVLETPVALEPPSAESGALSMESISLEPPVALTDASVPAVSGVSSIEISLPMVTNEPSQAVEVAPVTDAVEVVADVGPEIGQEAVHDSDLAHEMPYLFSKGEPSQSMIFAQPVGDAVVPGGAAQSPDTETLKKYLLLREQDVAALSAQLKAAQDELTAVKSQLVAERVHSEELQFSVSDQKRKIEDFEREKVLALEGVQAELTELRFQNKAKSDKAKLLESQVKEATLEIERLKERVRSDIRKIRVRERELENKLEIAKKDSEALLTARENKIIELKRKLDLLEFNMDLLQDRYTREKEGSAKLREKLSKAAQVVRVAEGLLDEPSTSPPEETKAS